MNKKEFLSKLSEALDKVEVAELTFFQMEFADYSPDNSLQEEKLAYLIVTLDYNIEKKIFTITSESEPFSCTMKYKDCEERGYCDGSC